MKFTIPSPLQQEHDALYDELRRATQVGGEVGEAAIASVSLMHPHFVQEEQFALPPMGLLGALARGDVVTFAHQLTQHARTEGEVMYPSAVLVGHHVRLLRGQRSDRRVAK